VAEWIDLLDPDEEELRRHAPHRLHPAVLERLLARPDPEGKTRPVLRGYGDYVFGLLQAAAFDTAGDRVYFQEVDLVVTPRVVLTVRKTPPDAMPFDAAHLREVLSARERVAPGMLVYHLLDEVAETYLDLLDDFDGEVDELEGHLEDWPQERIRDRLSTIRHDLLSIRRTLAPTRDAVRGVVDGRVDVDAGMLRREVFPEEAERALGVVLDKLLRATESLEFARDLLAAVRDYHATQIATEQNDVVKRLTAVASLILFPTFLVGVYGQNFEHMPELEWRLGYAFSWGIIVLVTLIQLYFFRKNRWL
jgi:magnesium transporter